MFCGTNFVKAIKAMKCIGPQREKTCLQGFANNTGADQPAHPRSLISACPIRFLESTIFNPASGKISIFWLVSVAEETGLKLALSETPKTGFLAMWPNLYYLFTSLKRFVMDMSILDPPQKLHGLGTTYVAL